MCNAHVSQKTPRVQHVATRILLFFFLLATLIQLPTLYKLILLLSIMSIFRSAPRLIAPALYRSRWIFMMIAMSHWLYTPGILIWPQYSYLPTWDGLILCGHAVAHLSSIITLYAVLIMPLTANNLIAGIWTLLKPLKYIGLSCERIIIRLGLIMSYVNNIEKNQQIPEYITIDIHPWPSYSLWLFSLWGIFLLLYTCYPSLPSELLHIIAKWSQ